MEAVLPDGTCLHGRRPGLSSNRQDNKPYDNNNSNNRIIIGGDCHCHGEDSFRSRRASLISKAEWDAMEVGGGGGSNNDNHGNDVTTKNNNSGGGDDIESTQLLNKKNNNNHHYDATTTNTTAAIDAELNVTAITCIKPPSATPDISNMNSKKNNINNPNIVAEIPAIIVTLMLNFMTAIPFGVAYFPMGWSNNPLSDDTGDTDSDSSDPSSSNSISGPFPFPGKEIIGIRMFLFACITGQIALNFVSRFTSPVSVQLIENIPFYHAMAAIVIQEQGYGKDALSTLFFLFGFSSVVTGLMFYILGKAGLGKVVYYFPTHVLVGFIGGIGVFVICTSTGVTTGQDFTFTMKGITHLMNHFDSYQPAVIFEVILRILMLVLRNEDGSQKFSLLAPCFFLSIVPLYYLSLWVMKISIEDATNSGAFFPRSPSDEDDDGGIIDDIIMNGVSDTASSFWNKALFDGHVLDIFRAINFRTISWTAVTKSLTTVLGVSIFSVINVPINIPAFANTCNVDVDMNQELIAHGYSNVFTGIFGGIQNVMTYSFSVLYYKSGGRSKLALWLLVVGFVFLFVFGVMVMPYIPRCLASTLLLHIGIDLVIEGVYDSYKEYDRIEYVGTLLVIISMTIWGMTPSLVTGIIVAMATYAIQNITYLDPIFTITTAETLRSSAWNRPSEAMDILDSPHVGRPRIMVVQLQGNVFFGNIVDAVDTVKKHLTKMEPIVVIIDFTLVVSMDSSAAQSINKLKNAMHQTYGVDTNIFVMGHHRGYFPCEYGLSTAILQEGCTSSDTAASTRSSRSNSTSSRNSSDDHEEKNNINKNSNNKDSVEPQQVQQVQKEQQQQQQKIIQKNQLCNEFDEALIFAEDILITREDPTLLAKENHFTKHLYEHKTKNGAQLTLEEEKELAIHYVQNLIRFNPLATNNDDDDRRRRENAILFLSYFQREVYQKDEFVWKTGDVSDSSKLVLSGKLVASMDDNKTGTYQRGYIKQEIPNGSFIGELGLIDGVSRLSSVKCEIYAVTYSLDRSSWEKMIREEPAVARILDHIAIRYLSHRVQHVSNRLIETRCLPV